jgi:hypothetical protein
VPETTDRVDVDYRTGGWKKYIRKEIPTKKPQPVRESHKIKFDSVYSSGNLVSGGIKKR